MIQAAYTCVNCEIPFQQEHIYKEHYKSQHHRYNVKRRLIGLAPLSLIDYHIQFQSEQSSKSQSSAQIYCEVCSKKFMSVMTYKQHINSQKHKNNRKKLIEHSNKQKSQTSSVSQFQLMVDQHKKTCCFCNCGHSNKHLETTHAFPPFKNECINFQGLLQYVTQIIKSGKCVFCKSQFGCEDSVKQHMIDVGHTKLNIDNFDEFQKFYLWKIVQSSEQDEIAQQTAQVQSQQFSMLKGQTLKSLQEKIQNRITYGVTGAVINGKQVGYRAYKKYYKQHLDRPIQPQPRNGPKAIQNSDKGHEIMTNVPKKLQFQKIIMNRNHR